MKQEFIAALLGYVRQSTDTAVNAADNVQALNAR